MYSVKMTPVASPFDSITVPGFETAREAWHYLMDSAEADESTYQGKDYIATEAGRTAYAEAIDKAHDLSWDRPGLMPVSIGANDVDSVVYGVIHEGE